MSKLIETFTDPSQAGYFSIGNVALQLSVAGINISRIQNDEEIMTLRAKYPLIVKSGYSRIDVTINWTALLITDNRGNTDFSQYEDLRSIVAMFRAAPFVLIENEHVRNYLTSDQNFAGSKDTTTPMAFALRDISIRTNADIVDGLDVTLSMTLFNYMPYSVDMAYRDSYGARVSPQNSDMFANYINTWKTQNLDKNSIEFPAPDWKTQNDSYTAFSYRLYKNITPPWPTPSAGTKPLVPNDAPTYYLDNGYLYDYFTTDTGFIYQNNAVSMGNDQFGSDDTFVRAVEIKMTNNLALIPLSNYQYPTYQHVGPSITNVGIAFTVSDPDSETVGALNGMITTLDSQFRAFRTVSRKPESIFRMQAIYVQNTILNMLGIHAIQPKSLNTVTLEDATSYEGQLIGIHYENYYEDLPGFRVTAPNSSYNEAVQTLSNPAVLGPISAQDQAVIKPLTDFYTAKANHDVSYLAANGFDLTTAGSSLIESMPQVALGATAITSTDTSTLKIVGSDIHDVNISTGLVTNTTPDSSVVPTLMNHCTSAGSLSYTDCVTLFALQSQYSFLGQTEFKPYATAFITAQTDVNTWALTQTPHPMDAIFDQLFTSLAQQNAGFAKALQSATASPQFQAAIQGSVITPGQDPYNIGHGAYTDLGLTGLTLNGEDYNPAIYFYNYNKQLYSTMYSTMSAKIADIIAPTIELNKQSNSAGNQLVPTDSNLLQYSKLTGIGQGNAYGVMLRSNVPGTSMAEAFPTFKLFLYEEDNNTIFYAFDNFYSYSSVSDIEVIRYQDKPDAAKIVLTNLSGLLSHRLFDNSADGKRSYEYEAGPAQPLSDDGSPLNDPTGAAKGFAYKDPGGFNWMPGINGQSVPNKYYALQTGSKIQIRMGYSNNPDKLWPVFTGQITEMSEKGDILVIEAQSFMLELMQPNDDALRSDGWSLPGVLADSLYASATIGPEFISTLCSNGLHPIDATTGYIANVWNIFNPYKKSRAYSGSAIFGVSGNADNVIKDMLKASNARHFGKWQINQNGDPLLKGFIWADLNPLPAGTVSSAISTLYDRSGENILINGYINVDGTTSPNTGINNTRRQWSFENVFYMPAQYSIPKEDNHRPTWDFIKDISRRYPEYILAVRQYGFPFGGDATLVYAHPNDWYRSRAVVVGDSTITAPNDSKDSNAFFNWWTGTGKSKFMSTIVPLAKEYNVYDDASSTSILDELINPGSTAINPDKIATKIDNTKSYQVFADYLARVLGNIQSYSKTSGALTQLNLLPALQNHNSVIDADSVTSILREAQTAVQMIVSGTLLQSTPDKSIQAVRQYHFIDSHSIIHNGMEVNEKIFNTVKIGDDTYCVNEFIPHHHRRLLDCNPLIVNPDANVKPQIMTSIRKSIAASFLKEEVSKMYSGEILLRGIPSIEPFDILMIQDTVTGIVGPVEVESVVHAFNQEMGSITIVRPKAMIMVNETFTLNSLSNLILGFSTASAQIRNILPEWNNAYTSAKVEVTGTGAALGAGGLLVTGLFGWAGAVATAAIIGLGSVAFFANTPELVPLIVCPVRKFKNPWYGGLQGYRVGDGIEHLGNIIRNFNIDNISPLIESYRTAKAFIAPTITGVGHVGTPSTPAVQGTNTISRPITGTSAIDVWAEAIRKFEGTAPTNASTRNNNPGNLEISGDLGKSGKFGVWSQWDLGVSALKSDISAKFRKYPNYSILQMMNRYLGGTDPNNVQVTSEGNPFTYANSIAKALGVPVTTLLKDLS